MYSAWCTSVIWGTPQRHLRDGDTVTKTHAVWVQDKRLNKQRKEEKLEQRKSITSRDKQISTYGRAELSDAGKKISESDPKG